MNGSQFNPVPITCPNCGFHIGEQAYFQSFEQKAAFWLKGEIAPVATKGYDVKGMEGFPELTFQVKYSTATPYLPKGKTAPQYAWKWVQKTLPGANTPDFYVLFGLFDTSEEKVFLLSKKDYLSESRENKLGQYVLKTSAKRFFDTRKRGMPTRIYSYEILEPEKNLIEAVKNYHQTERKIVLMQTPCTVCHEMDRGIYGFGMCRRCYQKVNRYKYAESNNERKRIKYRQQKSQAQLPTDIGSESF